VQNKRNNDRMDESGRSEYEKPRNFACKIEEKFYQPLGTQYNLPLYSATQIALKEQQGAHGT